MKKTLVSALTTALVVGAASTTFAAANPFSDVPADSWAYDAVATLAKDGVIDGYGDGTYRGDQQITRYEMAQMVARAMAKTDVSAADKAMIDKLAAEFADELNNLGVRVAALEQKVDNVKWQGELRYRYISKRDQSKTTQKTNTNQDLFRLNVTAQVNEHWVAKTRFDYSTDLNNSQNATSVTVDRAYVEGTYGKTVIDLGKFYYKSKADRGMFIDERVSGGQVTFGKDVKATVTIGRYNFNNYSVWDNSAAATGTYNTANYQGIEVYNSDKNKFTWGVAYHHLSGITNNNSITTYKDTSASIWDIGMGYKFNPTVALYGAYAKNTQGQGDNKNKKAYNIELDYKGANEANKGSFGIFAAYRYLGKYATLYNTYDGNWAANSGQKGWELGGQYTFAKNIKGTASYFRGKNIAADKDASTIFTQLEFFF
jgi:hypothetical protein